MERRQKLDAEAAAAEAAALRVAALEAELAVLAVTVKAKMEALEAVLEARGGERRMR